jgi:hypothetical protein
MPATQATDPTRLIFRARDLLCDRLSYGGRFPFADQNGPFCFSNVAAFRRVDSGGTSARLPRTTE